LLQDNHFISPICSNLTRIFWNFFKTAEHKGICKKKALITCTLETTLEEVVDQMLLNNVHRVFVLSPDNIPTSVVNFGDIIAEVLNH